jgi:hypothetical protein
MIQLHPDCLMFQVTGGESIPCSAELVTVELIGEAAGELDPEVIRNAARAVLHYFKVDMGKTFVSVGEFSRALSTVLRAFGLSVTPNSAEPPRRITEFDLRELACQPGKVFELTFFPRLRDELRHQLAWSPHILRFTGLRSCVKQLTGARRWTDRCQRLDDQIVEFLRRCLTAEPGAGGCSLVVL